MTRGTQKSPIVANISTMGNKDEAWYLESAAGVRSTSDLKEYVYPDLDDSRETIEKIDSTLLSLWAREAEGFESKAKDRFLNVKDTVGRVLSIHLYIQGSSDHYHASETRACVQGYDATSL